ncbi:ion transport [Bacteroidales bacterium]|nr:ion transport [Bacteroidales bacterium]
MFGIKLEFNNAYHHFGREDLDDFLQETITNTHKDSSIDKEVKFFQNALDFSQVKLKNCIVPRIEIVALDKRESRDELLLRFIETGLSKIVVYDDDLDKILGYIHSSELFKNPTDWTQHIKALPMVPENMSASKLLKRMLLEQNSMAVVVDEFGGTSGLITMEDLVEEIFGDIEDEHDTRSLIAKKISPTEFVLAGRMEVDKINEMFDLKIPESEEYTTVAGCILTAHERFPEFNEIISIDKYSFQIIKMSATKIELLRMKVNK